MAFTVTNKGLDYIVQNAFTASTDLRMMVFKGAVPVASVMRDWDFIADALASTLDEAAASGYSRQALDPIVTLSDAADNVTIAATAPVLTSVAAGETWTAVGYYVHTGSDATAVLVGIDVPTPTTLVTNGQNVTLPALSLTVTGS